MDESGYSKYLVEKARQLKAEDSLWNHSKDSDSFHRIRLDMSKVGHFLDFVFQNIYFEDAYFGTLSLKLENGTMFEIPQVVSKTQFRAMSSPFMRVTMIINKHLSRSNQI